MGWTVDQITTVLSLYLAALDGKISQAQAGALTGMGTWESLSRQADALLCGAKLGLTIPIHASPDVRDAGAVSDNVLKALVLHAFVAKGEMTREEALGFFGGTSEWFDLLRWACVEQAVELSERRAP